MTDLAADADAHHSSGDSAAARRRKRYAADRRLRGFGIAAISFALGLLGVLILTLVMSGYSAFIQTFIRVDFPISTEYVDPADPADGNFRRVMQAGISELLPGAESREEVRAITDIMTKNTQFFLRDERLTTSQATRSLATLGVEGQAARADQHP